MARTAADRLREKARLYGEFQSSKVPEPPHSGILEAGTPEVEPPHDPAAVATLRDLERAGAALKWIWPGWLQKGVVNVLASEGGCGKTRFVIDLLRRIRHGLSWPDGKPIEADRDSKFFWVVADENHDELVTLAHEFGVFDNILLNATPNDPFGGTSLNCIEEVASFHGRIAAVKPLAVIVDTGGNSTSRDLCRQEEATQFFKPLQQIARKQEVALICNLHLNAAGGVVGRRSVEKVRSVLTMTKPDPAGQPDRRKLLVSKSNSKMPPALGITMKTGSNEYDDSPPEGPEGGPAGRPPTKVLECIEWLRQRLSSGAVLVKTLIDEAEAKGFSTGTLYRAHDGITVEQLQGGRKVWLLKDMSSETVF